MTTNYVQFENLSWDSNDLIASKNACWKILSDYGEDWVRELEAEGYFGNLWVEAVIDEYYA